MASLERPAYRHVRQQNILASSKRSFFDDLRQHLSNGNTIDLVIFSGDLVQQGLQEEFELALIEIKKLFSVLEESNSRPAFFIVPGNHDLIRVDETTGLPFAIAEAGKRLENFKASVLPKGSNHSQITAIFKNYTKFINNLKQEGIQLVGETSGIFPGDSSSRLEINGLKIGLVGLNTAWSQVCGGEYKERIEIFADQFLRLVDHDPSGWLGENNLNFLITHHPASWLSKLSAKEFNTEIFLAKYFDLHLYGHMHEIEAIAEDHGDGHIKRTIQGCFAIWNGKGSKRRSKEASWLPLWHGI